MIEPLEPRIAPANAAITFTQPDGAEITVKVSGSGVTTASLAGKLVLVGGFLDKLDLTAPDFEGASVLVTAARGAGPNHGFVKIGLIDATGHDLGKVSIQGDVQAVLAGNAAKRGLAAKSFTATSMGLFNETGQVATGSTFDGDVGSLAIAGDLARVSISISGKAANVSISGDVVGGGTANSGSISAGAAGKVRIGGSLHGAAGTNSGYLEIVGKAGAVTIGGGLLGGGGAGSGSFFAGETAAIVIGRNITGGGGLGSGTVVIGGNATSLSIGGDLEGVGDSATQAGGAGFVEIGGNLKKLSVVGGISAGIASRTGNIMIAGTLATALIGGDLDATGSPAGPLNFVATLSASEIGKLTIGGTMSGNASAGVTQSASVVAGEIAAINVLGSLLNGAAIVASGEPLSPPKKDLAIGKLTIGGDVNGGAILAGYSGGPALAAFQAVNGSAQIGSVIIGGDFLDGDLVAGVNAVNGIFGDTGDARITAAEQTTVSKIASIVIHGIAGYFGSPAPNAVIAEEIGSLTIGGIKQPLINGAHNDSTATPLGSGSGLSYREV